MDKYSIAGWLVGFTVTFLFGLYGLGLAAIGFGLAVWMYRAENRELRETLALYRESEDG